jgi:8-oxo-dGTP pyrophosphatase MutT (NUDIX family)
MLVIDIPVSLIVQPVREAVRILIVDHEGRALLVRFRDEATGLSWWCPPGGGLETGEDHRHAAKRELAEEVGRDDLALGAFFGRRTHTFCFNRHWTTQRERWLVCRADRFTVPPERLELLAAEHVQEVRWWAAAELESSGILTAPRRLAVLIKEAASGARVDPERDLGR